jgi:hypothetical protein
MPGVRVRVVLLVKEFYITLSCWVRCFFTRVSATLTYRDLVFASEILNVERSHLTESGLHSRALAIASLVASPIYRWVVTYALAGDYFTYYTYLHPQSSLPPFSLVAPPKASLDRLSTTPRIPLFPALTWLGELE